MSVQFCSDTLFLERSDVVSAHPVADFILAAIKTAQNSNAETRADILDDVSRLLACNPKDLAFMFEQDTPPVYDRSIDLPDYRLALSGIYQNAA